MKRSSKPLYERICKAYHRCGICTRCLARRWWAGRLWLGGTTPGDIDASPVVVGNIDILEEPCK